ncbi:hypothetical protein [Haliangium sp.]|uniref:hypothetical protein n=1 Tax=Haliangium sp. TaxID=2663208 RepID=UPI003D0E34B8
MTPRPQLRDQPGQARPRAAAVEALRRSAREPAASGDAFDRVPIHRSPVPAPTAGDDGTGPEAGERARNRRLLRQASAQIQSVSAVIAAAKRDGSRSPEEIAEAEEALARLESMRDRLAASLGEPGTEPGTDETPPLDQTGADTGTDADPGVQLGGASGQR